MMPSPWQASSRGERCPGWTRLPSPFVVYDKTWGKLDSEEVNWKSENKQKIWNAIIFSPEGTDRRWGRIGDKEANWRWRQPQQRQTSWSLAERTQSKNVNCGFLSDPGPIMCVTMGSFFQITLLQAGIYPRHTKEQEKYRSYMFY